MALKGRDIISIKDLSREEIEEILKVAHRMIPIAEGTKIDRRLDGVLLALAFLEPSTRTRLSFETAHQRLGGRCITIADPATSSVAKGESLSDTVRMLSGYADAIVLRHPNEGAARLAAQMSDKPVINAGDGAGQHPTQTLLDLATIHEAHGTLSGLRVVLVGDLKYGRTVHSLAHALALFAAEIVLISPRRSSCPTKLQSIWTRWAPGFGKRTNSTGRYATRTSFTSPGFRRNGSETKRNMRRSPVRTGLTTPCLQEPNSGSLLCIPCLD